MPVASSKKIIELAQASDPKAAILKALGDLSNEDVLFDLVLVGTYVQPERRKSGLFIPEEALKEDEYQGIVGLVVKFGPEAAVLHESTEGPDIGDWVVYSIKDGWSLTIRDTPCRLVPYDRLRMRISSPKVIYDA